MANSGASSVDWRAEFTPETRMHLTQMIAYCLKRNQMGRRLSLDDLRKLAATYEAKVYTDATDRDEYLRKISSKMEKVDTITANPSHSNSSFANKSSLHSGSVGMRPNISQQPPPPFDQLHFQNQLQQQPMKLKIQHPTQLPTHVQQQLQQRPLFNPNQLQSSRQPLMPIKSFFESSSCTITTTHPRMMQSDPQHNQQNVIQQSWPQLMQHLPQSIAKQPTVYYQTNPRQQHPNSIPQKLVPQKIPQNFVFPLHQQQPLRNQQSNMHQKQMFPLPKNVPYMMHPSSSGHQNSLAYQTQKMQTAPLFHKQQLGLQSNISQLQQQRLVGPQSSVSGVQSCKRSMHMSQAKIEGEQKNQQPSLQSRKRSMHMSQAKIEGEQQNQQPSFTLCQSQDHQSQHRPPLQNLMPQTQSPQRLAMQKQNNPLQITKMQERSQASGSRVVAQSHDTVDQQNRSSQSQTGPQEISSSSSTDSTEGHAVDWQERTYRKIQTLKKLYLGKLSEEHKRIALKVQQQTLLPPAEQLEDWGELEVLMDQLLQAICFLQLDKANISVDMERKVAQYDRQIKGFLEAVRSRRIAAQHQFQHAGGHAQSILHQQPLQVTNLQQHDNHVNDCLQAQRCLLHDGSARPNKMKRHISAVSVNDTAEFESTATSNVRRQKGEADPAILKEIMEINHELFSTVVSLIKKDDMVSDSTGSGGGTTVKLSFSDVFLCPNFRSHYASGKMPSVTPLRLLVPNNYPESSPIILDKPQVDASKESVVFSLKVRSIFDLSIRTLVQPMSLSEMARTWDTSVRKVITEYAEKRGGGSFSSRYGAWESCANVRP